MSLLSENESLLKFVANKVKGFEIRQIDAVSGIYVTDVNGYIGIKINDYFSQNGSPYPGNYALVARGPDYSSMGLGRVTFLEYESHMRGGREYRCVTMPDGKVWMAENLDFLPDDGSIAKNPQGSPTTAAAWYYNRDEETYGWEGKKYGLLYNWFAARALTIAGWHLPTSTEWNTLATACGGISTCGTGLKSTRDWISGNGTDTWGFAGYPAGYYTSGFSDVGKFAMFWTSTEYSSDEYSSETAYNAYLFTGAQLLMRTNTQTQGYSVRLVKDAVPSGGGA